MCCTHESIIICKWEYPAKWAASQPRVSRSITGMCDIIYMNMCMYIYKTVYIYIYIYIYVLYTQMYNNMFTEVLSEMSCFSASRSKETSRYARCHMHIYIHICTCMYTHIYIYITAYINIHLCVYAHTYIHTYIHIHIFTCTYMILYICTYLYIFMRPHKYIYLYIDVYIYEGLYKHIHIHISNREYVYTYVHMYRIFLYLYQCTYIYICTRIEYFYTNICEHMYMSSWKLLRLVCCHIWWSFEIFEWTFCVIQKKKIRDSYVLVDGGGDAARNSRVRNEIVFKPNIQPVFCSPLTRYWACLCMCTHIIHKYTWMFHTVVQVGGCVCVCMCDMYTLFIVNTDANTYMY